MADDVKVEETTNPAELGETRHEPQTTEENKTIGTETKVISERDQLRLSVEEKILGEPAPLPPEPKKEAEPEKVEPEPKPDDDAERLKAKISKRIGKEVAKRKTLEEQLAERDAEIAALRAGKPAVEKSEEKEPSNEDIAAALKKSREDGDTKFEVEILDYIAERKAKKERKSAEESYNANQAKVTERQRKWLEIVQDYTVFDDSTGAEMKEHPMNLNNMRSQLYKTANALYLDPELKKLRYSTGTEAENLRRAVSDAYVELSRMGLEKLDGKSAQPETKTETIQDGKTAKERMKTTLAEPSGAAKEDVSEPRTPARPKNDQEKVLDEVKYRVRYRRDREAALI